MKIIWTDSAQLDIEIIVQTVSEYMGSAETAIRYVSEFNKIVDLAAYNPEMGKIGIVPNTRELYPINGKYRIVYTIKNEYLVVLTVVSSRQLYP